ncbi:MAG: radical SAM protein [Negativicutes bacterium]
MRYEGTIYRPPSEAHSLLIQCTIGCPHNRCTFCGMYKDKQFRIRSVTDIREDLTSAREYYGDSVRSLFLPDGNTILMKTAELVEILNYARELFPALSRITMYGSAQFLNLKTQAELSALRQAGLDRIHSGMESGDDVTLKNICKGSTAAEIISAGRKVIDAGMELSEYVLIGIGGLARSQEHALESARVLNAIVPNFIRLRTLIPMPETPLHESYCAGEFQLLRPHQALRETKLFIENLSMEGTALYSDHYSNYAWVHGRLPEEKQKMLQTIDELMQLPESQFRSPAEGSL